ncbi:IMP cyclohydrolase [Kribbella capetownensis]|uniref:IMP cyclohydrolase n=1 Tax=Kribbella capetownensis TaxID=1572659 RepID=UPI0013F3C37D|nr:IMP cyclohydrolase [Kribbella capetownensis]
MRGLVDVVGSVEYPGRGLVLGRDREGVAFAAYWLTGRTAASQGRKLVLSDDSVVVQDVSGASTDDLRHYTAAVRGDGWVVVGNGTQVSELAVARTAGRDLQLALRDHAYEPDPPIRTPRIFATASTDGTDLIVGSARSVPGASQELVEHPSLFVPELPPATAVHVSTYAGTAADVITSGYPEVVGIGSGWQDLADGVWNALDPSLRVALFVVPLAAPFSGADHRSETRTSTEYWSAR